MAQDEIRQLAQRILNVAPQDVDAGENRLLRIEGDLVSFSGSFADPGSADTHSYNWSVTKNGIAYATAWIVIFDGHELTPGGAPGTSPVHRPGGAMSGCGWVALTTFSMKAPP